MSDRITEELAPAPVASGLTFTEELPLLDGAVPLIRDEPWEWFAVLFDDPVTPTDLTGHTVAGELRWEVGEVPVTCEAVGAEAPGVVKMTLTAVETADMPFGQLLHLFLSLDGIDTEARVPVKVLEGYSS